MLEAGGLVPGGPSVVSESSCMSAADVISKHSGKNGSIAFAVRRPGERHHHYSYIAQYDYLNQAIISTKKSTHCYLLLSLFFVQGESCAARKAKVSAFWKIFIIICSN